MNSFLNNSPALSTLPLPLLLSFFSSLTRDGRRRRGKWKKREGSDGWGVLFSPRRYDASSVLIME